MLYLTQREYETYGTVLVSVAVGALVYLIALFLLKAFKKEDIEMLPKGEKIAKTLEKYSLLG